MLEYDSQTSLKFSGLILIDKRFAKSHILIKISKSASFSKSRTLATIVELLKKKILGDKCFLSDPLYFYRCLFIHSLCYFYPKS